MSTTFGMKTTDNITSEFAGKSGGTGLVITSEPVLPDVAESTHRVISSDPIYPPSN